MTLLDRICWSRGISREALASGTHVSKTRANAALAGLPEQGRFEATGQLIPEDVPLGERGSLIGASVLAMHESLKLCEPVR